MILEPSQYRVGGEVAIVKELCRNPDVVLKLAQEMPIHDRRHIAARIQSRTEATRFGGSFEGKEGYARFVSS
jgi:hypothetical protein